MIFNWYVKEQKSPGQIGKELNKLMTPPSKGKIWGRESVRLILKNVHYDGKVVFGRKKTTVVFENGKKVTKRLMQQPEDMLIVEGKHPAIVDHETFVLAQERLSDLTYTVPRTSKELSNPFAGLIKCPICGYAITYHSGRSHRSYNCKNYCSKVITHPALVSAVKTALLTVHLPELEAKLERGDGTSVVIQRQLVDRLEKQMADLKAQETKQYDLLETGIYTNEVFLERNSALRAKIASCDELLAEAKKKLPKAIDYDEKIRTLREAIESLDKDTVPVGEKNRLLREVIKRIEYTSDKNQPYGVNDFRLRIDLNI
jgi:hypothetical protein